MYGIECKLEGHILNTPELKIVKDGTLPVLTFPVDVTQKKTSKKTTVTVAVFGKQAESLHDQLTNNSQVRISGYLQHGGKQMGLKVTATDVKLASKAHSPEMLPIFQPDYPCL